MVWLVLAVAVGLAGLAAAARLHAAGRPVAGWLTCALTGLLVSPISWDHHWVWIAPGLAAGADAALRASGRSRQAAWGLLAALGAGLRGVAEPVEPPRRPGPLGADLVSAGHGLGPVRPRPHPEYAWHGVRLAGRQRLRCCAGWPRWPCCWPRRPGHATSC